jgi:hypothetical protein
VNRAFAILSSLLLIVVQTFAVTTPVSRGPAVAEPGCCDACADCACCVAESNGPSTPAPLTTAPARADSQFQFVLIGQPLFELPSIPASTAVLSSGVSRAAFEPPLFLRNCTLLI